MHDNFGWVEREGVLVCGYCGSVSKDFYEKADEVIDTDKIYKKYVIKDNKQYKFYVDHLDA